MRRRFPVSRNQAALCGAKAVTWAQFHSKSEQLAAEAEGALRQGDVDSARELYRAAAEAEGQALAALSTDKPRTLGITAVSASALWYKGGELKEAESTILHALTNASLPAFAAEQLKDLLQRVWDDQAQKSSGVEFLPHDVLVSVKGGEIVRGGAPLDTVVETVKGIQTFFYRTAEMLMQRPYRTRGPAAEDIQHMCRPWLLQTQPGSYQFAVRIQRPAQTEMFTEPAPEIEEIASRFIALLRASAEDPEGALPALATDPEYRPTFVELARNLAPTGKSHERIEVRSVDGLHENVVVLEPETRKKMTKSLRKLKPKKSDDTTATEKTLSGVLRGVHLDKDWLDVLLGEGEIARVKAISDLVDDVIGPMVNNRVRVDVVERKPGAYEYRDIQLDD